VLVLSSDALFDMFFPPQTLARLERLATVERSAEADSPPLRERIAAADALVTTWHAPFLSADMLDGTRVRAIVHCGGEIAARMDETIVDRLAVAHTPDPMAEPVAEMAMALVLSLVRRLPHYASAMRDGASPDNAVATEGETLAGRRVGIIGFGRIGRAVAKRLSPFGVELRVHDPHASRAAARSLGARRTDLDELLRTSSVVVIAAALTPETRGLLDRRRLALLPDGACLVNVARGALVDLPSLVDELRRERLSAALDVTDPVEPLPADHELRRLPNVLLTPHVAAAGIEVRRAMGLAAVAELERFFRGKPLSRAVTRRRLSRMT
jgi:phosphoglycerate dehydrogenase-like enzyme